MRGFSVVSTNGCTGFESSFDLSPAGNVRYQVLGFHGTGVVNHIFATNQMEAHQAISSVSVAPNILGQSLRGSIAVLVLDLWHNSVYLLADPLGGCMIQHYNARGVEVYSSDLESLKLTLASLGLKLEKNPSYLMSVGLVGNGGLVDSPFKDVSVLDQFTYISIHNNEIRELKYSLFDELVSTDLGLEDALALFLDDVSININAASRFHSRCKISQLTGGIDSRMVLAGLIRAGRSDEFSYFVGGAEDSLDVMTARNLCSNLGLTMTRYDGVDRVIRPSGIDELTWPLHETNGVLQGPADPGLSANDNVIFSGGYGEVFRSFYGKNRLPDLSSPYDTFTSIFGIYGVGDGSSDGLWNKNFVDETGDCIQSLITEYADSGINPSAQLDYLYLATRNRYYVGEISRSLSRFANRFDPLYSPFLVAILNRSAMDDRNSGELQLSVLHGMAPDLLSFPFDTPRFNSEFAERHGIVVNSSGSSNSPEFDSLTNRNPLRPTGAVALPENELLKKRALEINMPYHALREAQYSKDLILRLLNRGGNSELRDYFNIDALQRFLESPVKWRPQIRLLRRLGSNLAWLDSLPAD